MTGSEIIAEVRNRLDDTVVQNYGWSDEELIQYLNDAVYELCEKAYLIKDRDTPDICNITIISGVSEYPISSKIILVTEARLTSRKKILTPLIEDILIDFTGSDWLSAVGDTTHYAVDYDMRKIILYPEPDFNDTLTLTVYRYPLQHFTSSNIDTLSPEIPERWHFSLTYGIMAHAFLKNDMDLQNFPNFSNALNMWQKIITDAIRVSQKPAFWRINPVMRGLL